MAHTLSPWRSNRAFLFLFLQLSFFILVLWRELCQCVNTNTHIDMWCWRWPVQSEKGVPVEGVKPTQIFIQSEPPAVVSTYLKLDVFCIVRRVWMPHKGKNTNTAIPHTCWHVLIWLDFLTLEKRFVYATQCQINQPAICCRVFISTCWLHRLTEKTKAPSDRQKGNCYLYSQTRHLWCHKSPAQSGLRGVC